MAWASRSLWVPGAGGGRPFPTSAAQDTLDQNVLRTAGPSARSGGREGRGQRPSSGFGALQPPDLSLQPSGRGPVHKGTLTAPVSAVLAVPAPAPWLLISITFPSIRRENTGSPAAQHSHLGALCEHTPSSGADCCLKAPQVIPIRSWLLLGPTARFCERKCRRGLRSRCSPLPAPRPPAGGRGGGSLGGRAGPRNAQSGLPRGAPCVLRRPWVPLGAPGQY